MIVVGLLITVLGAFGGTPSFSRLGLLVVVVDLDKVKPTFWNHFLKVQVDIEFVKPLVLGCYFDLGLGVKWWLQFKFEKIGIFCYNCGCLGHQRRGYYLPSPVTVANCDRIMFPLYGSWLSTASSYQDVFSCANSIPRLGSSVALLAASKTVPPPVSLNVVGGKSMLPVSKSGRGSRRAKMVTARVSGGLDLGHQRRGYYLPSPVTVANCDRIMFPLYGSWLSTASSYQDVFSSANSIPRLGSSVALLAASKTVPPPVSLNVVGGKSMLPVSKSGRGSRRAKMVTARVSRGLDLDRIDGVIGPVNASTGPAIISNEESGPVCLGQVEKAVNGVVLYLEQVTIGPKDGGPLVDCGKFDVGSVMTCGAKGPSLLFVGEQRPIFPA
ncbi:hypothetical protein G4B88_007336 [Cannabis sativa]|uniref:Zinc knuckle CX2CX4HX4C domain-containing protein n=1 Tax=Cannabis sativa TaxID=3483 RepID=A0A7J6F7W7_CANSA|nr:hypothetical protein G4B88_007336 [Cannabis sativa]